MKHIESAEYKSRVRERESVRGHEGRCHGEQESRSTGGRWRPVLRERASEQPGRQDGTVAFIRLVGFSRDGDTRHACTPPRSGCRSMWFSLGRYSLPRCLVVILFLYLSLSYQAPLKVQCVGFSGIKRNGHCRKVI